MLVEEREGERIRRAEHHTQPVRLAAKYHLNSLREPAYPVNVPDSVGVYAMPMRPRRTGPDWAWVNEADIRV